MKRTLPLLFLSTAGMLAGPEDYVNFIRQIQADSGVEWDVTVAPQGSMLSPEGVGADGSLFQLWSIHNESAAEYHLDEEFVAAYTANAAITITTGDPYVHVPRTRVDQPFIVQVDLSGLESGAGIPVEAGQVLLAHGAGNYPEEMHSWADSTGEASGTTTAGGTETYADRYTVVGSAVLTTNGTQVLNYSMTSLQAADLTQAEGEEVWTISGLAGGGTTADPWVAGDILESAVLQVWPIAQANIAGLDPAGKYADLPPITVTLNDLYPDSTTWVRIYPGTDPSAVTPTDVVSSYVIIQDSIPQDRVLTLDGIDNLFPRSGDYTLEVMHQTPFGTEVLSSFYPLTIDRRIAIRGSIYSSD